MKKIPLILAALLLLTSLMFNIVSLVGDEGEVNTETLAEIQSKSESDTMYIQNLEDKIIEYENRISDLEIDNEESDQNDKEVANKLECLELVKKTPDAGPSTYIGVDIVNYYESVKENYNNMSRDDKELWSKNYDEAKPLYEAYALKCL